MFDTCCLLLGSLRALLWKACILFPSHPYSRIVLLYALFTALRNTLSGRLICSVIWVSLSSMTARHRFRACSSVSKPSGTTSIL